MISVYLYAMQGCGHYDNLYFADHLTQIQGSKINF